VRGMRAFEIFGLVLLIVIGALVGGLGLVRVLVRYQATTALSFQGDVQLYRRAEEILKSADWFRRFSRGREITETHRRIEDQLRRGVSPIAFEHSFRLSRSDFRDLPDTVAKAVASQLAHSNVEKLMHARAEDMQVSSELVVSATDRDAKLAIELADVAHQFARDALLRISLMDAVRMWTADAAADLAAVRSQIIAYRAAVESLSRRINEMERMRNGYQDGARVSGPDASTQVQVTGPRYLSPSQQIIGLEAERIDVAEQLRLAQLSAQRLETVHRIGGAFDKLLDSESNASKALKLLADELARQSSLLEGQQPPLPAVAAIADMERVVVGLRSRFVDASPIPPEPTVRREGPGRLLLAACGAFAGFIVWLAWMHFGSRWSGRVAAGRTPYGDWRPGRETGGRLQPIIDFPEQFGT